MQPFGAPNFYRIWITSTCRRGLSAPIRCCTAEVFNDVPGSDRHLSDDITGPGDPRYLLQPPYNKVSRQREPGRVNLNTVTSRRSRGSERTACR